VADKNADVTEAAEETAGRADAAQDDQSEVGQSEIVESENGQSEIVESESGQSEIEQSSGRRSEDSARPGTDRAELGDGAAPEDPGRTGKAAPDGRRAWRVAGALGAATVVLGGFGVWATLQAGSERSSAAAQNTALTDGPATATVRREIAAAVNTIFSYSYANTAATRRAAQGLLTGPAVRQYDTLFALVTKTAPAQKLIVTTRVTNTGVEVLNGDRARLLVFANQQDTRAGTGQTSYAGAMFAVTALHQGGRWKIENIDTSSG